MRLLGALLVIGIAAIFAVIGISRDQDSKFRQSPEGIAMSDRIKAAKADRAEVQQRVKKLSADGCSGAVETILAQHRSKPIMTRTDISAALIADLDLCFERGIMREDSRDQMKDTGLLKFM